MRDWKPRLRDIVEHGPELPEPYNDIYSPNPPSGLPWPEALPACPPLAAFYEICDGGGSMGPMAFTFEFSGLAELESLTSDQADEMEIEGDDDFALTPGRWLVFGYSEYGHIMFWDAGQDRVVAWDHDGGGWHSSPQDETDPIGRTMEGFLDVLFFAPPPDPARDAAQALTPEGWIIPLPEGEMSWYDALDRVHRP